MAVDPLETRRQRIVDALPAGATRTWSRTVGANTLAFTLANPQIRQLNGGRVFSVECTVTRNGTVIYDDRVNMPNPAVAVMAADKTVTDNPLQALRDTLMDVVNIWTRGFTQARLERNPDGSFKGDTLAVRAGTNDGQVFSSDADFATMAAGSGLTSSNTDTSTAVFWSVDGTPAYSGRFMLEDYDTSTITAGATITGAVYTFYGDGAAEVDADNYNLDVRYKDWGGTVTTADWFDPRSPVWNALVAGGIFDVGSWNQTAAAANNFSDSSAYGSINKTGTTRIVLWLSGVNAATPTGDNEVTVRAANVAGTSSDPLLTVTYTLPAGTASGQMMDMASQAQAALLGY